MGVTNVNGQNQINLVKLALAKKGKVATDNKPQYLQMTGSIFNAPRTTRTTASTLTDLNTNRTLTDLNRNRVAVTPANTNANSNSPNDIGSASDGRAAITNANNQAGLVKAGTVETQSNTKVVNNFSNSAIKLSSTIDKSDKSFQQKLRRQEAELKNDNKKLQTIIKNQEELHTQVTNAQNELEFLVASSSVNGTSSGNSDRIKELRSLIGSKTVLMQANGKTIYSLQRNSNRTIRQMQKTNKAYIKTQNQNINQIEQEQTTTDKIIKVANDVEKYSALTAQVGQLLNLAGVGLVALSATPGMQWAGPVGRVMQKIGKITENIGQYGQSAANITKTAAYAADGNLMAAMQSAAAAVQTGAAAVKSSMNMSKSFDAINASAQEAMQKNAAAQAADQIVEEKQNEALVNLANEQGSIDIDEFRKDGVTDYKGLEKALKENGYTDEMIENAQRDALGGMRAKDAKRWIRDDLRGQLSENNTNVKFSNLRNSVNELKDEANTSFGEIKSSYQDARNIAFAENQITQNTDGTFTQHKLDKNGGIKKKNISARKADRLTRRSFDNHPTYTPKHSTSVGSLLSEFGNGIMSTAAMLAQSDQTATNHTNARNQRGLTPMRYDARMQRILGANQRRRAAYV